MSLEEEIAIYQFAQGVPSDHALPDLFAELDRDQQYIQFFNLLNLLYKPRPTPSDVEQAMAEGSFAPDYTPCVRPDGSFRHPGFDIAQDYTFLLYLIKAIYQRRVDQDKGATTTWWYEDLSNPEVVQGILARHEALVEELYTNPGYRSEFRTLARLQHEHRQERSMQASQPKDDSGIVKKHQFVTYDEMVQASASLIRESSKYLYGITILHGALVKALTRSYRLNQHHVMRVVSAVLERYSREMYPTDV